jgi:predicted nucleic acid-binding protein
VLVDTSALVAFLDRDDPRHASVVATFAELASDDLVTHGYVVAESIAVVRRRLGVDGVIALLDDLLPVMGLLQVEPALHAAAQARYRASLPSGTSFVDQVSLGVMEREAISTAFALDDDFVAAGVAVLPRP